jgi:phage gp29-like protein
MFIGNLLLGDNSQTGTYAQSQTQLEFGNMVFDGILEEIANTIQEQIINPVVEFNFGSSIKPPVFSFDKFTSGDMKKLFEIVKPLMDSGVVDSENSAVQESLSLLFKAEAGVEYTNDEPVMPEENFDYQEPLEEEPVTEDILSDLEDIYGDAT